MVINYKNLLSESLLILNTTKTLKKITVTDLQKESGISRQTFYNHFLDIDDLIQYTYKKEIVVHWDPHDLDLDFYDHIIEDFSKTKKYHKFLKDAFDIHGQNNLLEYTINYCVQFEQEWMQSFYGNETMPNSMLNAVAFAAGGSMYMKIRWIMNGIDRPLLDVAQDVIDNENRCLTPLFFVNPDDSPFEKSAQKIRNERQKESIRD
jgi:Transcriptional regulator